jgi:hypothetical protein
VVDMASIILYLLVPLGAIILGFILVAFPYLLYNLIKDMLIKRKIPKDKKKLKEYLEKNSEFFKYPPQEKISRKEVEEDEQKRFKRFREFEKLRRTANPPTASSGVTGERPTELNQGSDAERGILQNESTGIPEQSSRKVKLD